jgi:hypothetical protein
MSAAASRDAQLQRSAQLQLALRMLSGITSSSSSSSRPGARGEASSEAAVLQVVLVACSLQLLGLLIEAVLAVIAETEAAEAEETADAAAEAAVDAAEDTAEAAAEAAISDSEDAASEASSASVDDPIALFLQVSVSITPDFDTTLLACMTQAAAWLQQQLALLGADWQQQQQPQSSAAAAAAAAAGVQSCLIPGPILEDLQRRCRCIAGTGACSTWQQYQQQQQQQQQQHDAEAFTAASLSKSLQQLGATVASQLPLPYCCNNPSCRTLDGLSEQELVSGKSTRCGGCRIARYCSDACYRAH